MPLTKEQLLIPRYKVIALWPFEYVSRIGDIHHQPDVSRGGQWTALWNWWDEMAKHPHLFQPLPWWSDRKPEDMPEYLKWRTKQQIVKPVRWEANCEFYYLSEHDIVGYYSDYTDPATEEEYNAYINQKQQ